MYCTIRKTETIFIWISSTNLFLVLDNLWDRCSLLQEPPIAWYLEKLLAAATVIMHVTTVPDLCRVGKSGILYTIASLTKSTSMVLLKNSPKALETFRPSLFLNHSEFIPLKPSS